MTKAQLAALYNRVEFYCILHAANADTKWEYWHCHRIKLQDICRKLFRKHIYEIL